MNTEPLSNEQKLCFANGLKEFINNLENSDVYIASSVYNSYLEKNQEEKKYFQNLQNDKLLEVYCENNGLDFKDFQKDFNTLGHVKDLVENRNEKIIKSQLESEKDYLDNILNDMDSSVLLDDDQRKVVLTDEDNCLVIAGAGAGKTTTIAAKIKYLVDKQKIPEDQILLLSFTDKTVNELKTKLNKKLKINCTISTFHSLGLNILKQNGYKIKRVIINKDRDKIFKDYFNDNILMNSNLVDDLVTFFSSYCEASAEEIKDKAVLFHKLSKKAFTTLKNDFGEMVQPAGLLLAAGNLCIHLNSALLYFSSRL